jgi:hypothetical protein
MQHVAKLVRIACLVFASLRLCVRFFLRQSPFSAGLSLALAVLPAFCLTVISPASAMDHVTLRRDGKTMEVAGKVLVTAQDGGMLLLARDGVLWLIPPDEQVEHKSDAKPFTPLGREEITRQLLAELPPGFQEFTTTHYLIFYNTSPEYARWCGSLFERLYKAFTNCWSRNRFELTEPEFPLVAIVFADRSSYLHFSRPELGEAGQSIIGYFGLISNRMTMYDLTGVAAHGHGRMGTTAQINEILSQPEALRTVSTIVHEATHQIAFNCGLHTRLSDCPRWFSEGIAMYFETPDLRSAKGWGGIGNVNRPRLEQFQQSLADRAANSLETLLRDDKRFADPKRALNAYAEAWALTYFLIHKHPKEYVAYLRLLSAKKPLLQDSAEERLDEFRRIFGDPAKLNAEFVRYMVRAR